MDRILVSLPDQKIKKLDVIARKMRKSRAQLIREAVDAYIRKGDDEPSWKELVDGCCGLLRSSKVSKS